MLSITIDPRCQAIQWENELSNYEEQSVAGTFARQFDLLNKESHDIGNLLKVLSFFDPENIPVGMIVDGAKEWLRLQDELHPIHKERDAKNQPEDVTKNTPPISSQFAPWLLILSSPR
jgi:hypothetical protein